MHCVSESEKLSWKHSSCWRSLIYSLWEQLTGFFLTGRICAAENNSYIPLLWRYDAMQWGHRNLNIYPLLVKMWLVTLGWIGCLLSIWGWTDWVRLIKSILDMNCSSSKKMQINRKWSKTLIVKVFLFGWFDLILIPFWDDCMHKVSMTELMTCCRTHSRVYQKIRHHQVPLTYYLSAKKRFSV